MALTVAELRETDFAGLLPGRALPTEGAVLAMTV